MSRRNAFTLTELLVAVAIMAGMMTMVAMIFTTASRSSGQAQAMSSLHRQARQVAEGIRRDLAAIDPADGVLGVVRRDVAAHLTQQDRDSERTLNRNLTDPRNDVYRADVLMLMTRRAFKPYVYQPGDAGEYDHAFADRRLMVYGHADQGTLQANGTWLAAATRRIEGPGGNLPESEIPAAQWHLARRTIGFPLDPDLLGNLGTHTWRWPLVDDRFTGRVSAPDQFADVCEYPWQHEDPAEPQISPKANLLPKGHFRYDTTNRVKMYYVEGFGPVGDQRAYRHEGSSLPMPGYYLHREDSGYLYWWRYAAGADPWTREQDGSTVLPGWTNNPAPDVTLFEGADAWNWTQWFYQGPDSRSLLDPNPPAGPELERRLAHYYLPGCSEFRIEFTFDDPREIDLDRRPSEDPRVPRLIDWHGDSTAIPSPNVPAPAPIRWHSVPDGERWVWSGLSLDSSQYTQPDLRDRTHPYVWPRAVRITLRVHDPAGRLPEPITETIVHAWR